MLEIDASNKSLREVNRRIRESISKGPVLVKNAEHLHGLAAGLRKGEVLVEGDVGDYLAMLNSGARVVVEGSAGDFAGDGAWDGEVVVKREAGDGVGIYAYGGTIVVLGDAGDGVGQLLKGGTVLIGGSAGDKVGLYMVGGELVISGDAGKLLGDWMIGGKIYIAGAYETLGRNAREEPLNREEKRRLEELLKRYGLEGDAEKFRKIVPVSTRPFYGKVERWPRW